MIQIMKTFVVALSVVVILTFMYLNLDPILNLYFDSFNSLHLSESTNSEVDFNDSVITNVFSSDNLIRLRFLDRTEKLKKRCRALGYYRSGHLDFTYSRLLYSKSYQFINCFVAKVRNFYLVNFE